MLIDVCDFDGTIFRGDSTVQFTLYCLKKHPLLIRFAPVLFFSGLMHLIGLWDLTRAKSGILKYFRAIDLDREAEAFWRDEKTLRRLNGWFKPDENALPVVIASASPERMLAPMARLYGDVPLIGTVVEAQTGHIIGQNCRGHEKIRRLKERWPGMEIHAMYTDSVKSDGPLLALAQERFLVRDGQVRKLTQSEWAGMMRPEFN